MKMVHFCQHWHSHCKCASTLTFVKLCSLLATAYLFLFRILNSINCQLYSKTVKVCYTIFTLKIWIKPTCRDLISAHFYKYASQTFVSCEVHFIATFQVGYFILYKWYKGELPHKIISKHHSDQTWTHNPDMCCINKCCFARKLDATL